MLNLIQHALKKDKGGLLPPLANLPSQALSGLLLALSTSINPTLSYRAMKMIRDFLRSNKGRSCSSLNDQDSDSIFGIPNEDDFEVRGRTCCHS